MSHLRAGIAKCDITTENKLVKVIDPLYAKALALDDGDTQIVILTLDCVAIGGICDISDDFVAALRTRIEKELKLPGANVLINASHTHPPDPILCEEDVLLDRTFNVVREAMENLTPATVGVGKGREDRITMNRTLRMKDGSQWTVRHSNPSPPDEDVESLGPHDPDIGVIRVDRADGTPLACVYNFAGHMLWGDCHGSVTANFTGVASGVIERTLGHGALALFIQGAAGDVIDVFFKDFNRPRDVTPIGQMLAISTLDAWREIKTADAKLSTTSQILKLPRRDDVPQRVEVLEREQAELIKAMRFTTLDFKLFLPMYLRYQLDPDYPGDFKFRYMQSEKIGSDAFTAMDKLNRANMDKYLSNIRAMEKIARLQDKIATHWRHKAINDESGETTVDAEVQGIKIGDAVIITSTTEVLTQVALNIKAASPYDHTFIAAFTNGYIHYGAPAADYDAGGYEVTECLLGPGWQTMFEQAAAEIIAKL
jgi:hypothetical protein